MVSSAANIERSKFSLKRLTVVGEAIDEFEVKDEHILTHSVVRTAHGWSAEIEVETSLTIDGVLYRGTRIIRIPLSEPKSI